MIQKFNAAAEAAFSRLTFPGPVVNRNGFEPSFDPSVLIDTFDVVGCTEGFTAVAKFDRAGALRSFECVDMSGTSVAAQV